MTKTVNIHGTFVIPRRKKLYVVIMTPTGKTTAIIRNRKGMKLLGSQKKKHSKYVMKPNFEDGYRFSKELFAVEMG